MFAFYVLGNLMFESNHKQTNKQTNKRISYNIDKSEVGTPLSNFYKNKELYKILKLLSEYFSLIHAMK